MQFDSNEQLADFVAANPDCKNIEIVGGPALTTLVLPRSVTTVWIWAGPGLAGLPELPDSLLFLRVMNCPKILCLPALPGSLKSLWVHGCDMLETVPKLPDSLACLWMSGCKGLKNLPSMPEWWSEKPRILDSSVDCGHFADE
jgi:hypothetical protein